MSYCDHDFRHINAKSFEAFAFSMVEEYRIGRLRLHYRKPTTRIEKIKAAPKVYSAEEETQYSPELLTPPLPALI